MKVYLTNKPLVLCFSDLFDSETSSKSHCHWACSAVYSYYSVAIVAALIWPLLHRAFSPQMTFAAMFVLLGETDLCSSPYYNSVIYSSLDNICIYYPLFMIRYLPKVLHKI